jgi:hypothetical protein
MDMHLSHGALFLLLNDHSWYRIETPLDYLRAALWCLANLATAFAYFAIPIELRHWSRVLPFSTSWLLGALFMGFILFCGLSHLSMLVIMQTGPWWATLGIYLPMAAVSSATAIVMRRDRAVILAVLDGVAKALKAEAK